jgi:glycosyltransferase involved in cell wall biosynthesis
MNYVLSVVVSVYNSRRFIFGKLQDLSNQTLYKKGQMEIIIVNTGSPYGEDKIIKKFLLHYPHIRYLYIPHRETVYAAWNRAIVMAHTPLITNSNTDDRLRPDALEIMSRSLMQSDENTALVYCRSYLHHFPNQRWSSKIRFSSIYQNPPERRPNYYEIGPNPVWRRSLHERFGLFDARYKAAGDHIFFSHVAKHYQFLEIPEVLGLWYRDTKNKSNLGFQSERELKTIEPLPFPMTQLEIKKQFNY